MQAAFQGPTGDILEEILGKGPGAFRTCVIKYGLSSPGNRVGIALAGLSLGEELRVAVQEWVSVPDSNEKWALMTGLAEQGCLEAEGYFLRFLREKVPDRDPVAALRALGAVGGARGLPALIAALSNPELFAPACDALAAHGAPEALAALSRHADAPEAFCALARVAGEEQRPLILEGIHKGTPFDAAAARALGRLGRREDSSLLAGLLSTQDPELLSAAALAYAQCGAAEGAGPLLSALSPELKQDPPDWLLAVLGRIDDPAAAALAAAQLTAPPKPSLLKRLFRLTKKQEETPRRPEVLAALARARDPALLRELTSCVRRDQEPRVLAAVFPNPALFHFPEAEKALGDLLLRGSPLAEYLLIDAWAHQPSRAYFSLALRFLQRNGFVEMDTAWGVSDEERMMEACAQENNPCLLLGAFLDAGAVDVEALQPHLRRRYQRWHFAKPLKNEDLLAPDEGFAEFLDIVARVHPSMKDDLRRLWGLLLEIPAGTNPLFEIFWSHTGLHRGGVHRLIARRFEESVWLWTKDQNDAFLPEIEAVSGSLPREGALRAPLAAVFDAARTRLKSQCKDMVVWMEGGRQGDMVLIDKL